MSDSVKDKILVLCAVAQASADADEENAHATGWVVAVTDPETEVVEMFGPWPKDRVIDAAAWADEHLDRFTAAGDDGIPLTANVYPLFAPGIG